LKVVNVYTVPLMVALTACGSPAPVAPVVPKPVDPPVPPCSPAGDVALAPDGVLRCAELPVTVAFPPGSKILRQNDHALTVFSAKLEHGILLLVAEPRADAPDATRIRDLLTSLIKGIAADATVTPIDVPALAGASLATGLSFATPDGGAGEIHAYFANHWLIAAAVGGRLATTETRPDKPAAKAFLASLALRSVPTGNRRYPLADGAHLEIPASAWATGLQPAQDGVRSEEILMLPDAGVWLGIRELELRDRCTYLQGAVAGEHDDIGDRLKTIYASAQNPLARIERAQLGDISVYAEADSETMHVVMYLICAGKSIVQLTVAGDRPDAELRPTLDTVARTLVGAP